MLGAAFGKMGSNRTCGSAAPENRRFATVKVSYADFVAVHGVNWYRKRMPYFQTEEAAVE
jgi:hypothetical protein